MPSRANPFLSRLLADWRNSRKNTSKSARRRPVRPVLEALEDRLTPSAGVQEQYMLDLINRFRANPTAELNLILSANDADVNNALTFFNVDKTTLAAQFAALTPAPPLAWNDVLYGTSLAHSQAMLAKMDQSHQVAGEADLGTRVTSAGYAYTLVGENIYAFAHSVFEAEAAFAIDWGSNPPTGIQSPPGHRNNLMAVDLREVGIGLVNAPTGSSMGPLLVTQDFGNRSDIGNPFLLGSVFADTNQDGFYEPGEGLGGVNLTITGAAGTFQATTTAAGGYQLQVPVGTYQVTASGGGLTGPVMKTVVVGTDNVEADFIKQQLPAPSFTGPASPTTNTAPTISWTATAGAQYDLWVNDLTTGAQQVIRNLTLTTNSYTPATPLSAGTYQAWVRVTVSGATSPWSAAYGFTINPPAIPSFTAPTGSSTNLTPMFSWTASTDAVRYDLWVTNTTTGQSQIIRQPNLASTSFTPGSVLPVGSYMAWVQAFNNAGNSAGWSAAANFAILAPAAPVITGPAAVITTTTPTFSWNASTGATQYDVWADNTTTGQNQIVRQTVAATSLTPANPLPHGQYTYWVRAENSAGSFGPWSGSYNFLIDSTAPAIPTITAPASPTANVTPTISWSASAGATRYDLWVNDVTTGQGQVIRQQNLPSASFAPGSALPIGSYTAWVEAFDNTNATRGWSAGYSFVITAPAAPTGLSPSGLTTITPPTFSWNMVAGAVTYDLWVDDVSTKQSQIIRQLALAANSFLPAAALAKGNYRFWVRATNADGNAGAWSAEADFTIG